jgi:hypothetical protein
LCRLTDAKYELAVVGLLQAAIRPWALDLRENSFRAKQVILTSIVGCTSLTSLNMLSCANGPRSMQRDRQNTIILPWQVCKC